MRAATMCLLLALTFAALGALHPAEASAADKMKVQGQVVLLDDDSYALRTEMGDVPLRGDFLLYAGQEVEAVGTVEQDEERGGVFDVLTMTPAQRQAGPIKANPYN